MKQLIAITAFALLIFLSACTDNQRAKAWGGIITVDIPKGNKLVTATWKNEDLWYLYTPMASEDVPKTSILKEQSSFGVIEGAVHFVETK